MCEVSIVRIAAVLAAVLGLSSSAIGAERAEGAELQRLASGFRSTVAPFLQKHCLDCHGAEQPEAELSLSGYSSLADVRAAHGTWEIVLKRLRAQEMPPEDAASQPEPEVRQQVIDWIESLRQFEVAQNAGDPGPVLARRLSNAEYDDSIRDLTGVDIQPTKTFPVDPANKAGFDNSGESLTMSPALLKKYLKAARQVVEHLVLTPDGLTFAPHPVISVTDRDKFCVRRIIDFYERQPTNLADYFFAAWQLQSQVPDGAEQSQPDASLQQVAEANGVSAKYLRTVYALLTEDDPQACVGPVATLRKLWRELPRPDADAGTPGDALTQSSTEEAVRRQCSEMRDFVVQLRKELQPKVKKIHVEGLHVGSQTRVLYRNRQRVENRRTFDRGVLDRTDEGNESGKSSSDGGRKDGGSSSDGGKDSNDGTGEQAAESSSDAEKNAGDEEPELSRIEKLIDHALHVPDAGAERSRYEAALERFCSVFPDTFYVSERGRDYVKESRKQMGERGRLLSAGFHSMTGYFRDDRPLYDLILTEAGQRRLDKLWDELNFITSAPMRQYQGFLWFERTDSRYMRDPEFDFARPENSEALTEPMIRKLSDVYIRKAARNGGDEAERQAIRRYFEIINQQIRRVERMRKEAQPDHLHAVLNFANRAYRRDLTPTERDELTAFYHSLRDDEELSHEEAIQDTLVSVLMSPSFCYRVDLIGVGSGQRPLTNDELASRLSYFLWSSLPDEPLRNAAASGELTRPEVLVTQTKRMLKDDRIRGLATEFAGNWLDFRRFEQHNSVDRERFPSFNDELRQAMFEEPIRFFMDVAQRDRSVLSFVNGRHTFTNGVLAEHYGMPIKSNRGWMRVDDADDFNRGGLLPMSVFLTKNAPGLRTSPVKRGYWVVRRLLGERIPPPPPNVPELPEDESKLGDLTLREALAKHRAHPSCAGCHKRFDSIGIAFESYGPIGERREKDLGGRPVNTQASFPGGHNGDGLKDLKAYLLEHRREEFLDNVCRKLLAYALGRGLILSDEPLIEKMRRRLEADGYRFGSLIETIVTSPQFLNKRGSGYLTRE